jgi:hypothetical protein
MKNSISFLLIAIIMVAANSVSAQNKQELLKNKSGVYMSFADFKAQKLNLEVDYTKEKHKIKSNDFLNKSDIDVIHMDKKYTFAKKDIYGFRDSKGVDFRFFENKEYQIIAADTIFLYLKQENVQVKTGKNPQNKSVDKYYLSLSGNSEILPLTVANLKQAFPENHKMHDALDMMFKSDNDLAEYDKFHKSFKVIRFIKGEMEH